MEEFMKRYVALTIIALCCLATGYARGATSWERLGAREVDFGRDRDTIEVGKKEGKFKQLQIRVKGAPIEISDIVVTFANDQKFTPDVRHRFDEGEGSRVIDLPGDRRGIRKIDFNYRSINRREGKGRVEVYAR
jgi:hypothetical protein